MRIRSLPASLALVAGVLAAALLSPVASLADGPIHLDLEVGSRCVSGHKTTDEPIKVKLLRHDGTAIETRHDDTSELSWSVCFHHRPVAGNRLQMVNGTRQRTATVPDLTIDLDRVASVIKGHAPAGKTIVIRYVACEPAYCLKVPAFTIDASSHGRYRLDLSSSNDIDGSDQARVEYENGRGDVFHRMGTAPHMQIAKPNRISLSCMPRGATTVRLLTSTGVLRASKTFHANQDCRAFSGRFRTAGHDVNVHVGDKVTADFATDARMVWPTMSVNGSGTTLSGRCFANVRLEVVVARGPGLTGYPGMTDADGRFETTVDTPFAPGDTLELICETSRGDRVRMVRTLETV